MKVYLDNSATSWPKPEGVIKSITNLVQNYGGNPGRSGHEFSLRVARDVFDTRELVAGFIGAPSSDNIIFTSNGTHALNIAIKGILKKNDHVIVSSVEHNAVMRPLRAIEKERNLEITIVQCDSFGQINPLDIEKSFKKNTKAVITVHGSNVTGTLLPIHEIGAICKKHGVLYMVDASQSVGLIPIHMQNDCIDVLAFTGHKKLYAPPGIGCLCIGKDVVIDEHMQGGTGSNSENDFMPDFYPDKLEAGTKNTYGVVGMKASLEFILANGIENMRKEMMEKTGKMISGLKAIPGVTVYGSMNLKEKLPTISFNIAGKIPGDVAPILDKDYGIMVRAGLHCSPNAHRTIGTFPTGTVRFGLGHFNTEEEIRYALEVVAKIVASSE